MYLSIYLSIPVRSDNYGYVPMVAFMQFWRRVQTTYILTYLLTVCVMQSAYVLLVTD